MVILSRRAIPHRAVRDSAAGNRQELPLHGHNLQIGASSHHFFIISKQLYGILCLAWLFSPRVCLNRGQIRSARRGGSPTAPTFVDADRGIINVMS